MTLSKRRIPFGAALIIALVAACAPTTPSASPSASVAAPSASAAPSAASTAPSLTPTSAPTTAPTASPTTAAACPIEPEDGPLPSDRLVNVVASTTSNADLLTFVFGNMSVPGPGGPPVSELSVAEPPFTFGPSGLPIDMVGEHVAQIVFRGMSLQADTGDLVYTGPPELRPDGPALKHAVEYDESEGVIGWYVGYDGPGCVTLTRDGSNVTLTFAHAG
jgi:hypothetical protein